MQTTQQRLTLDIVLVAACAFGTLFAVLTFG